MKKVSVIIPVYNAEQYLDKCLNSLINQTLEEIEIIIIDDGSTDNSKAIIKEYKEKYDEKIVLIYLPKNKKQGYARNRGLEIAKGEYILFVDSDDYVDLKICEEICLKSIKYKYDIICFDMIEVYDNYTKEKKLQYTSKIDGILDDEKRSKLLNSPGYFTTRAYNRKMLIENNIKFPENMFYEDSPFNFLSLLYAKSVSKIDKCLYFYLQRDGSSSNCKNENRLYDRITALEFMFKEVNLRGIYAINKSKIDEKYIKMTVGNIHLCLDMFDKPETIKLKEISQSLKENIEGYKKLNEYKRLDKVSKLYISLNKISPKILLNVDKLYKLILKVKG